MTHLQVLVQLGAPRVLHTMTGPQLLLHRRWPSEGDRVVYLRIVRIQRTGRVQCPLLDVVDEGDVVAGMPVQGVEHRVKLYRVQEFVNRCQDLMGGDEKGKSSNKDYYANDIPIY